MMIGGTEFEKKRGVSRVEVRRGFAQVHVFGLEDGTVEQRLRVLEAIAAIGVSIDFLKLTPSGLSFLAPDGRSEDVEQALAQLTIKFTVQKGRSIVLVHAVNMRDEEGLIAELVQAAIASGAAVDHVSDMHDRMLIVVADSDAETLAACYSHHLKEAVVAN